MLKSSSKTNPRVLIFTSTKQLNTKHEYCACDSIVKSKQKSSLSPQPQRLGPAQSYSEWRPGPQANQIPLQCHKSAISNHRSPCFQVQHWFLPGGAQNNFSLIQPVQVFKTFPADTIVYMAWVYTFPTDKVKLLYCTYCSDNTSLHQCLESVTVRWPLDSCRKWVLTGTHKMTLWLTVTFLELIRHKHTHTKNKIIW